MWTDSKEKTKMVMFLPPNYRTYHLLSSSYFTVTSRTLALVASVIAIVFSLICCSFYVWRLTKNYARYHGNDDIYYGIQIATFVIVSVHLASISLAVALYRGIRKEQLHLVSLWIIGVIIFISLEGVATIYCNILRDHLNKGFDETAVFELSFYGIRILINIIAIISVIKFFRDLRKRLFWEELDDITV